MKQLAMPTKVTLECTGDSYVWRVFAGEKKLAELEMKLNEYGATGTTKGGIDDKLAVYDGLEELADAIESDNPYRIANALRNLR